MVEIASGGAVTRRPYVVRPLEAADVPPLEALIRAVENFQPAEVDVAVELVGLAAGPPPGSDDYRVLVADGPSGEGLLGYACFGPTPMTRSTWDLYWIAVAAPARGAGCGRALHEQLVRDVREAGGRRIRVETSSKQDYDATQRFYEHAGYRQTGRIDCFYADDDHLLILICELDG